MFFFSFSTPHPFSSSITCDEKEREKTQIFTTRASLTFNARTLFSQISKKKVS